MRTCKRYISIFLFLCVLGIVFSGCGSPTKKPGQPGSGSTSSDGSPVLIQRGKPYGHDFKRLDEEMPELKPIKKYDKSMFHIRTYPESVFVNGHKAVVDFPGGKSVLKAAKFRTVDDISKVKEHFLKQFDNPTVVNNGEGLLAITYRSRDLLESDELTMVTIEKSKSGNQTEIVIFSHK